MHSAPVFLKSVPIVTTSRKSAKSMTAQRSRSWCLESSGEEAEPVSMCVGGGGVPGWFGWFSCPNSSISTKPLPENGVPS